VGGSGQDNLQGNSGNDFIDARDGEVDTISCGEDQGSGARGDQDRVLADSIDVFTDRDNCEKVRITEASSPPTSTSPSLTPGAPGSSGDNRSEGPAPGTEQRNPRADEENRGTEERNARANERDPRG